MEREFPTDKCYSCGILFGALRTPGYPHYCEKCKVERAAKIKEFHRMPKISCEICGRKVWQHGGGMENHLRMVHEIIVAKSKKV